MRYRTVGRSGLKVSAIGLGCNNFGMRIDEEGTRAVIHAALDAGITFFDTADVYGQRGGSEKLVGKILGQRRKDVVIASKFGLPMDDERRKSGASRRYIMLAVEDSLKRLNTDWIDLYQLHRDDPETPLEETVRALDDLVRAGKVRYVGCSNLPAWKVVEAQWIARETGAAPFISCQDELSMLVRDIEHDLLPAIDHYGMSLIPFFPLASGVLTGKYRRDDAPAPGTRLSEWKAAVYDRHRNERGWAIVDRLRAFCDANALSMSDVALAWLLAKPRVSSVIAGATSPAQVVANTRAALLDLSPGQLVEIENLLKA